MTGKPRAKQTRFTWIRDRPTVDMLILMIAGTICISTLGYGVAVAVLVFVQPQKNHGPAVALLSSTFQLLIGLLAGFVAGRTEKTLRSGSEGDDAGADHR